MQDSENAPLVRPSLGRLAGYAPHRSLVFWQDCCRWLRSTRRRRTNPGIVLSATPIAIEAGRLLFASGCAACHGAEGQGGRGPNLRERIYWHPVDEDVLYKVIQKGIPAGGMPAAALDEDQLWQVVAYVRSLTAPAIETVVPGDPAAGEALFWGKAGCSGCHAIRGRGGKLGPDLTNAGAIAPAAPASPGYPRSGCRRRCGLSQGKRGSAQGHGAPGRRPQPYKLFSSSYRMLMEICTCCPCRISRR